MSAIDPVHPGYGAETWGAIRLHAGEAASALPTPEEMAQADAFTIQQGTSAELLMERAGTAIHGVLKRRNLIGAGTRVLIAVGPGNNGGDGLVLARQLAEEGIPVCIVTLEGQIQSPLQKLNLSRYQGERLSFGGARGIGIPELSARLAACDLVIDALLGTGQRAAPRAGMAELVECIRGSGKSVVSIDIPTGSNGATGELFEPAITACVTIALQNIKCGLLQYPLRSAAGIVESVDLGIRFAQLPTVHLSTMPTLVPRAATAHKGIFGHVLVVGGSRAMPGAATLAAHAALRSGAGRVTKVLGGWIGEGAWPEVTYLPLTHSRDCYGPEDIAQIAAALAGADVVVLGPGLGTAAATKEFVQGFIKELLRLQKRVVLDADALTILAELRLPLSPEWIITPHPGEASRLLEVATHEVQRDRYEAARLLSARYGCVVLLKGPSTIIWSKDGGWVNPTGGPALATPGSGDVLAGVIAARFAQGLSAVEAACQGAWFHGQAGDRAAERGILIASDIVEALPSVLR